MESNHSTKIDTPPEIAKGPKGKPAYIVLRTRFKGKYKKVFYDISDIVAKIQALPTVEESVTEALSLSAQLRDKKTLVTEAYTQLIIDWNWTDDDGEPLPKPTGLGVVQDELYPEQEEWINDQLRALFRRRAVEGNPTNGSGSQTG